MEDGDEDMADAGTDTNWDGDTYKVTHKGEKFVLRPSEMQ